MGPGTENKIRVSFADQLMEVIAAVVESAGITYDQYIAQLDDQKIKELHGRILPVFVACHKKGVDDAKIVFAQAVVKK